ncbi:MAG: site-specific integrase [Actinobacteria bacterium]|nr:site-specific integrase [Actinomycetota bacterium]
MGKRIKTNYPGVYYRIKRNKNTWKEERIYYIHYRLRLPDGGWKQHEEAVGSQLRDNMTPAKANNIRARRLSGNEKPNTVRRSEAKTRKRQEKWTVSALWEEYKGMNPNLKGYHVYDPIFNAHLKPLFGDKQPKEITPFDINRLKQRQMKGKSNGSIANVLELLRRIVNFGIKNNFCLGPGFTIQLPRVNNLKTEDLTPEQLKRLLEIIDSHIEYRTPYATGAYMMKLSLLTGMRRSEMFRLRWDDIDRYRGNIILRDAKSGRNEVIPMSSYTHELLNGAQEEAGDNPLVFPSPKGEERSDIRRQVNHIKGQAGLPDDFRPLHGLRHVFASNLISRGVSREIVARLLTHKGVTVTDRYAHIRDDALREAAELAGRLLEELFEGATVTNLQRVR